MELIISNNKYAVVALSVIIYSNYILCVQHSVIIYDKSLDLY